MDSQAASISGKNEEPPGRVHSDARTSVRYGESAAAALTPEVVEALDNRRGLAHGGIRDQLIRSYR